MNILMDARFGKWMGGINYIYNMTYALMQIEEAKEQIKTFIYVENEEQAKNYQKLVLDYPNAKIVYEKKGGLNELKKHIRKLIFHTILKKDVAYDLSDGIVERLKADVIYPLKQSDFKYNKIGVFWIPDFQYVHLPDLYSKEQLEATIEKYDKMVAVHKKLVLSSNSALADYKSLYPDKTQGVFVVPFASCIDIDAIKSVDLNNLKGKYHIDSQTYFMISNQFWQHKNHGIVFDAIKILKDKYKMSPCVVCTGLMEDSRNPEYIRSLEKKIDDYGIRENIILTGIIPRNEQLALMNGSLAVIQPSLFEGWGTVVEDAKSLNKKVIMSDLDVHYEQKNENCCIYHKDSAEELAELMRGFLEDTPIPLKIYDCYEASKAYGSMFFEAIRA